MSILAQLSIAMIGKDANMEKFKDILVDARDKQTQDIPMDHFKGFNACEDADLRGPIQEERR